MVVGAFAAFAPPAASAQSEPADSVTIVPGEGYDASGLYRALMGSGHRDLWITPIRVPVADLTRLAGGLTPMRIGGGTTTRTLHLRGADGRRYVFRSVDKTPRELLEDLEGTPLAAIIQDQVSVFHPSAAPVVARLLDAVGVLHPEPQYMVVPDDPALGEFREEFAGMLVLFEERPDVLEDGSPGFAGATEIVQTDDLLDALEEDPRHAVDAEEVLRARLIDLLVGDRDRSHNNHLWARVDEPGGRVRWRIVPRDRDQSFVRFDGFLKWVARSYDPRLVAFGPDYSKTEAVSRNAWDIDRSLLVGLDRAEWWNVVEEVRTALSDDVLREAVARLPDPHRALVGDALVSALQGRRDRLDVVAGELYDVVFRYADIHLTDEPERVDVTRDTGGAVRIVATAEGVDRPTFDRVFAPEETREVRLYLRGGSDRAVVRGEFDGGPLLRVIGGGGRDRLTREGPTDARLVFYDGDDDTDFRVPAGSRVERRAAPRPFAWFEEERTLDWGSRRTPLPGLGFDEDRGLVVTLGMRLDRFGFLKRPWSDRTEVKVGFAFAEEQPILEARHVRTRALGGADLRLRARWSGIELIDYFGQGNESVPVGDTEFHRVEHKRLVVQASLGFGDEDDAYVSVGPSFRFISTDTTETDTFVSQTDPYGSGRFGQLGLSAQLGVDRRDMKGTPTAGYRLEAGAGVFPSWLDARHSFGTVHGTAAAYLSSEGGNPTLALRGGAKRIWGRYPFAESAFIGGARTVRGLREERYAGHASVFGSAELRFYLARLFLLTPTDVGGFVFVDGGRVYAENEVSDRWHRGAGAGIWFAALRRSSTVQLSIARSEGRAAVYFGLGFAY